MSDERTRSRGTDEFSQTVADVHSETLVGESSVWEDDDDLSGRRMAHFQVEEHIRNGGMGTIWRAVDLSLDRPVALKVLSSELTESAALVERFVREARSQARLSHANVVPIYFIGEQKGLMFFAMELIEGESLADRLERGERVEWPEAVELMIGVARALRHAHERGLIHRDIKPGNLLVDHGGHVKVTDFGLARPIDDDGRKLTGKGVFLGTPWYASPEQARAHDLDHRSDMYALGATFFHLLTGRPLFEGRTAFEILAKHAADPPELEPLASRVPPRAVELFEKLLAKEPDVRPADHDVVVQELKRFRARPIHDTSRTPAVT